MDNNTGEFFGFIFAALGFLFVIGLVWCVLFGGLYLLTGTWALAHFWQLTGIILGSLCLAGILGNG